MSKENNGKKSVTLDDLLPQSEGMRYFIGALATICTITAVMEIANRVTAATIKAL